MSVRTQEQIDQQIAALKSERESLPEYSAFGDNNWTTMDAQIEILAGTATIEDFVDDNEVYDAAVRAQEWLDDLGADDLSW